MKNCSLRRRLRPSGAMEDKSSGSGQKEEASTTNLPAEEAVPAAASLLTDDLIFEILSRLPARSVHRFKCVSPSWRDLIADPANRKKLSQTLAGFVYCTHDTYGTSDPLFHHPHFANVSVGAGAAPPVDLSLPFLPPDEYWHVAQLDTCNGLLLCLGYMDPCASTDMNSPVEARFIVCNPATEMWVDLPPNPEVRTDHRILARLAFDPAASSHFHVLHFEEIGLEKLVTGVNIYSSQTGAWKHRHSPLVERISLRAGLTSVFFHGMLHLLGVLKPTKKDDDVLLVAVDMEGQVWKTIRLPSGGLSFTIGLSQGCLHYATTPLATVDKSKKQSTTLVASLWCMKDYDSKQWILKHSVSHDELQSITRMEYKVTAIHPDCDLIFLDSCVGDTLASYDMQHRKFRRILNLQENRAAVFLPYVPLFSGSLAGADGQ
ncbi:F-box protein At1g30790-like [Hordeum vulgare subsp. vulgare]|uniref:F-box domain-containing protein n=1 Tax=Hordeum vulgare subsp. vulgare TaxID=112509 RepID=A0A8I6WHH7_HORVV|nr:F-box protein At1g30790-like [Hordeum vulgare subsp. vulgare]